MLTCIIYLLHISHTTVPKGTMAALKRQMEVISSGAGEVVASRIRLIPKEKRRGVSYTFCVFCQCSKSRTCCTDRHSTLSLLT